LLLNGISEGYHSNATNGVFIWKNVTLKTGENQLTARAERAGKKLSDGCTWTLEPPQPDLPNPAEQK